MVSSALNPYFKGAIDIEATVTSSDGSVFVAQDDSCLVKRQPIAVEFTPDTVKYFKPGLPYEGKVCQQRERKKNSPFLDPAARENRVRFLNTLL